MPLGLRGLELLQLQLQPLQYGPRRSAVITTVTEGRAAQPDSSRITFFTGTQARRTPRLYDSSARLLSERDITSSPPDDT